MTLLFPGEALVHLSPLTCKAQVAGDLWGSRPGIFWWGSPKTKGRQPVKMDGLGLCSQGKLLCGLGQATSPELQYLCL